MEPPRETISLLITSILGGLAITNSVTLIQEQLSLQGLGIPLYRVIYFLVFVSVWLRFIPGNLSHIRRLERSVHSSVGTWLLDISVIFTESLLLVFMSSPSVANPGQFVFALLALLFLDIIWLASMIPGVKKETRPEPQWPWLWLNVPSAVIVVIVLLINIQFPNLRVLESGACLIIVGIVFALSASVDVYCSAPDWFGRPRKCEVSEETRKKYKEHMNEAIEEAKKGLLSKGIPIGAVLMENGNIIGRGHNRRIQDSNPTAHAEIECLRNAGRRQNYEGTILYSTLMPCHLCAGAIVQFGIKTVVVGESKNFEGAKSLLQDSGVKVFDLEMKECCEMLNDYIKKNPTIWNEDIGIAPVKTTKC